MAGSGGRQKREEVLHLVGHVKNNFTLKPKQSTEYTNRDRRVDRDEEDIHPVPFICVSCQRTPGLNDEMNAERGTARRWPQ